MRRGLACILGAIAFMVPVAYNTPSAQDRPASRSGGGSQLEQAVLARYCVTCHNQRVKTGGLALDTLDLGNVGAHAAIGRRSAL